MKQKNHTKQPEAPQVVRSKIMHGTGFRIENASLNLLADTVEELRTMHRALKRAGLFHAPFKPESCGRYVVVELPQEAKPK